MNMNALSSASICRPFVRRMSSLLLLGSSLMLASAAHAQVEDEVTAMTSPTSLKLINGWKGAGYGTSKAEVETIGGIVHFKGSIYTSGTDSEPFVLPKAFRPLHDVYVPVDLCDATNGRLLIQPSGDVYVQAETNFNDAACFTSLDGASYALNGSGFTTLSTINGWTSSPFHTGAAQVKNISGVVHLKGAIATSGSSAEPFILPKGFRPAHDVYVPVDLCSATNGRLYIQPNGVVTVEAEKNFNDAQCFTSLDGAWFVEKDSGYHTLSLTNNWSDAPYGTSKAKVVKTGGVVYFEGSVATSGENSEPFTLPSSFIPEKVVYVPVDLCNAAKGRLYIQPNGVVSVQTENGFSAAQCFTSLDGVSFVQ